MDQFVFAFFGGLLSFVSPCVLPLVPAYLSYISGLSLEDLTGRRSSGMVSGVALNAAVFVAGFSLIFILLGASATFLGRLVSGHMMLLRKVAGAVLVLFGLHFMGILRIAFLNYEKRFHLRTRRVTFVQTFFLGIFFALGWTPCIGPILAGILAMAGTQESVQSGILLLGVYAMGLGVPFLLTAMATAWSLNFFDRIKRHFRAVEVTAGALLVTMGVLIYTNRLGFLSGMIMNLFPFLGRLG